MKSAFKINSDFMTFLRIAELEYMLMAFKGHGGEVRKVCGKI